MKKLITSVASVAVALCLANAHAAPACTFKSAGSVWTNTTCEGQSYNVENFITRCAKLVPSLKSLETTPFVKVTSDSCSSITCTLECSF